MKRLIPTAIPVILLCLAVLLPGCPQGTGTVDPDGGGIDTREVQGDTQPPDPDVCVVDCGGDTRDIDVPDEGVVDPCLCEADSCGVLPDCDGKNCGLCGPSDDCLNNLCVPKGSPGTPCEEDDDCEDDAPCLGTDPRVCGGPCDEDEDCPKHMFCVEQPGDPDPIFTCIPGCPDGEGCSEESCGFVANGCGTFAPCGDCLGDNEICGAENLCVCEFEACGDAVVTCCGSDETCTEGVCVSLCDPPCADPCTECVAGNCLPVDCPPGTFCVNGICEILGLPCDGCSADADCAPGLICDGNVCRAGIDANCDGCDDDGDGETDDDYESDDTCGEGVCKEGNSPSVCVDGLETACQPGPPLAFEDVTCDNVDDDCDGATDDDYVPDASCGEGACETGNTPSTCAEGVETPCQEGPPNSDEDALCDGVDDDCDGETDEDYESDDTCGVGWCKTNNTPSVCVDGVDLPCEPGTPSPTDFSCNNVDDDCDGDPDDDYIVDSSCGVGVCNFGNTPSACVDGFETPCQPGDPISATDAACDGFDDDCDGLTDEDYVPDSSCGVGYCKLENVPAFCENGQETPCKPADPLGEVDDQCDYLDDDCDGEIDEDADPPCATGAPVAGADVSFLATLGLPSGIVGDNGNGTYSSTIVDLTNPNQDGALSASCNGNVSDPFAFSVVAGDVAAVDLSLSQPYVCADAASVRACARLTDDLGAPAAIGVPVEFTLEMDGIEAVTQPGVAEYPGLSCAWLAAPGTVFAAGAAGTVTAAAGGITSEAMPLDATALPGGLVLDVGEAGINLPLCARLAGSSFEVPVTVNTGDSELGSYNISCAFDGNVLEVQGVTQGSATAMGVPVASIHTGQVSFTAINTEVDGTAKGPSVEIALLSFKVKDNAGTGDAAAVNCEIIDLFNTNLVNIASDDTVQIHDGDGQGTNGFVDILSLTVSGVFPTLSDNALIDMAKVNGDAAVALVNVLGLMNDGSLEDLSDALGTICEAMDPAVAVSAGCAVTATGPGVTTISASAGGHVAEAPLWVLAPQLPGEASLTDSDLRYIPHIDRLQEARISVVLNFTDGNLFSFDLDVTGHVGFASTVPAVAQVDDTGLVSGVGNGEATIIAIGALGDELGGANLQVQGGEDESPTGVHVVVPATVLVTGFDPVAVPDGLGEAAVGATVTNLFDTDGQQVQASVLLILSDDEATNGGSRIDITGWKDSDSGGAASFGSSDDDVISVDENGVVTAVGSGQATVEVHFENSTTGYSIDGNGSVEVQLPPPQSVDLTADDPRLALNEEDTAFTILGLPVERQLDVLVHFVNGTSKDFTFLPQTLYTVTGSLVSVTNYADCAGVPGCSPGVVSSTGLGTGTAQVTVTFPGTYLEVVTASLVIEVVAHDELLLKSVEIYTPEGEEPVADQVLSWVECTQYRQQARLVVEEVFSDGSVVDLSAHPGTTYGVYSVGTEEPDASVITVNPDTDRIIAVDEGTADVKAMSSGHKSVALQILVDNAQLDVLDLAMTYAPGSTFHGIKDTGTGQLDVVATFADGTRALTTGADFIPGLLTFVSDAPAAAIVDAQGLMTAKGNGPTLLTAELVEAMDCGDAYQVAPGLALKVNLLPVDGDVDMGHFSGLAFPDQPAAAIFQIPVRVNTGGADLGGVDLEITYDPAVILPLDAEAGGPLEGAIFSANLATPGVIYLNASPALNTPVSGGGVEVAVITFEALKANGPQVTFIGGTVVGVVDTDGVGIGAGTPREIVAGAGQFDPPPGDIWGDANDDEIFSIADVLFVQQIIVDPPLVIPTPTQVIQSDLFPDGFVASADAFYASRTLARLVHFVEVEIIGSETIPGQSEIIVTVTDRDQEPISEDLVVRVELETIANLDTVVFTEVHGETANGVVTTLPAGINPGEYSTTVGGLMEAEPDDKGIGLVVILDVLGPDGEVLETTAFIQTPLVDPAADFVPIAYVDEICDGTCDGKACGDDNGCGTPCIGECPSENQICINAECVCGGISCAGKACGEDDGCGNPCVVPCPDGDQECTPDGCVCPGVDCEGDCCAADVECAEYPPGYGTMQCMDCVPDCEGAACGDEDGCGWYCAGSCDEVNQICDEDFVCVCGGDFCDGECCPVNHVCLNNECCEVLTCEGEGWECGTHYVGCSTFVGCGSCGIDGICTQDFLCDCDYEKCLGTCCGPLETCDPDTGECAEVCIPDCTQGQLCGEDDGCGDPCEGSCALSNEICVGGAGAWACGCVHEECNGVCCDEGLVCDCTTGDCAVPCAPDCAGKFCGEDDGCCGTCHGFCPMDYQFCSDGKCLCEGNNGFLCGDVCCPWGWDCQDGVCDEIYEQDCFGQPCGGDDGYGGICLTGFCSEAAEICQAGVCVCEFEFCGGICCGEGEVCDGDLCCEPMDCAAYGDPECGELWDGCGAYLDCGACDDNEECSEDLECVCIFQDEPCGDVCCGEYEACLGDVCQAACIPVCEGKPCGAGDECGGQCEGACLGSNEACILTATVPTSVWDCQCQGTSCLGKACGEDDGCGGICGGPCPGENEVCDAGVCVCAGNGGAPCGEDAICCTADDICKETTPGVFECKLDCDPVCVDDLGDPLACGTPDGCGGNCIGFCEGVNVVCSEEQFLCECAGAYCVDGCCPANNVCYLDECCELEVCEDMGHECGAHYVGCGTFTNCGSCGAWGICTNDYLCECENAECNGECCEPGFICEDGACVDPCIPSCADVACGGPPSCGPGECYGDCPVDEICTQIGLDDYECECVYLACGDGCCPDGYACASGQCYVCDPEVNCEGKMCGEDDLCGGICDGDCPGPNEYCVQATGECLCANGELPCNGECCPWAYFCDLDTGLCQWDCEPDCEEAACGDHDGCGGFCDGTCAGDRICVNNANCVCPELTCGTNCCGLDQVCDDEDCCDPITCEAYGDIECGVVYDGCGYPLDCGSCEEGWVCNVDLECECEFDLCDDVCCGKDEVCLGGACCAPQCEGKDCGAPDLCGFLCQGPCDGDAEVCIDGVCLCGGANCAGKACGGDDGCGGVCTVGVCEGASEICANGVCICANGDEECDGTCCPAEYFCFNGECVDCMPSCPVDAACGDPDGCGSFCTGTCDGDNMVCSDQFYCECAGEFCADACCPDHHVCLDDECCQLDSCDSVQPFGATCGVHDLGCDTLSSCGDCADQGENMFCNTFSWTCECAYAECEGECCAEGLACWPGQGCVDCIPDCEGKACGMSDGCGEVCSEGTCTDPLATCEGGVCECVDEECDSICCPDGWSCNQDDECEDICPPICLGKMCGDDDGCGNECPGDCPGMNETCIGGACFCEYAFCAGGCCAEGEACVDEACAPCEPQSCDSLGASCGFVDQCDASLFCGACGPGEICDGNECVCAYEDCLGFCCGADEVCNGVQCVPCPYDCTGASCGDPNGCGGFCDGDCPLGGNEVCVAGECVCEYLDCAGACCAASEWCIGDECVYCVADCDDKACGEDNGCGVSCDGPCPGENTVCQAGDCQCHHIECDGICCGPGEACDDGECVCMFTVCSGVCCGDGDSCLGGTCCTPDCEDKLCGASNGCAAPCLGPCFGDNRICDLGTCVCEFDACADECCAGDEVCFEGACVPCVGNCMGKECGVDDGCGLPCDGPCPLANQICDSQVGACYCEFATCGTSCCGDGEACVDGECSNCTPDCDGKACGEDSGCGYTCDGDCPGAFETCFFGDCVCTDVDCFGTCCAPGEDCSNGTCCTLDCDGKACGESDGCGGACQGPCPGDNVVCAEGQCLCEHIECFGECCVEGASCANDTCCFPQTCDDLGAECGLPGDGCGNVQYCGACSDVEYCAGDYTCDCAWGDLCGDQCCGENEECQGAVCEVICEPTPCTELNCGEDNGCGTLCLQGNCPDGWAQCYNGVCECDLLACGDSCCGPDEICIEDSCCPLLACDDLSAECGVLESSCGGVSDCGACGTNQWCDELNLCYCTWETCGDTCCDEGKVCHDGACCQPQTCEDLNAACGAPSDGCGEILDCGECYFEEVCGAAFQCECPGIICNDICCGEGVIECLPVEDGGDCDGPAQDCEGKNCGDDDGNGGLCGGPCPDPEAFCDFGVCKCSFEECGDVCCPESDTCADGVCVLCVPDCANQGCGADDGCGGGCDGPCAGASEECVSGVCYCLYESCDGVCCASDEVCEDAVCVEFCDAAANCEDKVCGAPDGCDGSCNAGYCLGENYLCLNGVCECGGVICGGACCAGNEACIEAECVCIPSCLGKLCGEGDGCGGTCSDGICPENELCLAGICECEFVACEDACCAEGLGCVGGQCSCVPDCNQQICGGSDGCGGICDGPCEIINTECIDFECVCLSDLVCGGICCEEGQDCFLDACCEPATCADFPAVECGIVQDVCGGPLFCGACGPNQWCAATGVCECLFDECGDVCCGEGLSCIDGECCVPETCETLGYACGSQHFDGCYNNNLDCGLCPENEFCNQEFQCECEYLLCDGACCAEEEICNGGQCGACVPDCDGKLCGADDGCEGVCDGTCEWDLLVCVDGGCACVFEQCGPTCCGDGQTCVDDVCVCPAGEELCGESCCPNGETCGVGDVCECAPDCTPGADCGKPDGCGELCPGVCPIPEQTCWSQIGLGCVCEFAECVDVCCAEGEECSNGQCVDCIPACDGKACGDPSGCGYPCDGSCPLGDLQLCAGGECGCFYDSCGEACCGEFEACNPVTELCEVVCIPDCDGKACGELDPICNKACDGSCPGAFDVCENGTCICVTTCTPDSPCGEPDGCGDFCQNPCSDGWLCEGALGCVCPFDECNGVCCGEEESCNGLTDLCDACTPDCDGKNCGEDNGCGYGCLGPCTESFSICENNGGFDCVCVYDECNDTCCGPDEACDAGSGVCAPCVQDCDGKACGADNGCGYGCDGFCEGENQVCQAELGVCECQYSTCADSCCGLDESCDIVTGECILCQPDCVDAVCGHDSGCGYFCDGTCPGDQVCDPSGTCGCEAADVPCGTLCCSDGLECYNGACVDCVPACEDADCGDDDSCGGYCFGDCPIEGQFCQAAFGLGCLCPYDECNDACCAEGESCNTQTGLCDSCTPNCDGKECGDDNGCGYGCSAPCSDPFAFCEPTGGIGCSCIYDDCIDTCCGPDQVCDAGSGVCTDCIPDCDGKACGADNGCGYGCDGFCAGDNEVCQADLGVCVCQYATCADSCCDMDASCDIVTGECTVCVADCVDAVCGQDSGCGYLCDGPCPGEQVCSPNGTCGCEGADAPCGVLCCAPGLDCFDDACVDCVPGCAGSNCGDADGCGGFCIGECPIEGQFCETEVGLGCMCPFDECDNACCEEGESCNEQTGLCDSCTPDCAGKACGDDNGCGYGCLLPCSDPFALCDPIAGVGCSCVYDECDDTCCGPDEACDAESGVCTVCVPDCVGKACGADNGCGYGCDGFCVGADQVCEPETGACICQYATCADSCCGLDESCDVMSGECILCLPDCVDAVCGDDSGCGYPCDGTCPGDQVCDPNGNCGCGILNEPCGDLCCDPGWECFNGICVDCAPNCDGTVCGDSDGCGGFCAGDCPIEGQFCETVIGLGCVCPFDECDNACCADDESCNAQTGLCDSCTPDCDGKECGDDNGCGYGCNVACSDPFASCNPVGGIGCSCAFDECDDACCGPDESCDAVLGVCTNCVPDCVGKVCGADNGCGYGCDGSCAGENQVCQADLGVCECLYATCADTCCALEESCDVQTGECSACVPDCVDAVCGDDSGCGYFCDGTCTGEQVCDPSGICSCGILEVVCGDLCCAAGLECFDGACVDCAPDCGGAACGDSDGCGAFCPGDCPIEGQACESEIGLGCLCPFAECDGVCCDAEESCNAQTGLCDSCTPDCAGKACGEDNGCGYGCMVPCPDSVSFCAIGGLGCLCSFMECEGVCCGPDETCVSGQCNVCTPDCVGATCGADDGCGGLCDGACTDPAHMCLADAGLGCECIYAECGDACCGANEACDPQSGQCLPCTPDCNGKVCGDDDGCGSACNLPCANPDQFCAPLLGVGCLCLYADCGEDTCCSKDESCFGDQCVACVPDCAGKACGDESGCGYACNGTCGANEYCLGSVCLCEFNSCFGVCCDEGESCGVGGACE